MITVQCDELEHSFKIQFRYDRAAVERIKSIPGRQFRKDLGSCWLIPKTSQRALERFLAWAEGKAASREIQRSYVNPVTVYPTRSKGEKLWKHQLAAFRYLWNRQATLIDLKPGSGKSRIFVDFCLNTPEIRRILILCPKSFVGGWSAQFEKYGGSPVVCACLDAEAGTVPQRVQVGLRTLREAHERNLLAVIVINYDVCWCDDAGMADFLLDAQFDVVGYDEIQRLRGHNTKVSRFAHRLGASIPIRIGLSGTPFPESPLDSFGVCRALDASLFGTSYHRFRSRYAVMGGYGNFQVKSFINTGELRAKIDTLRFTMEPEGYELPSEQDITIPLMLPEKVQKLYRALERDLYAKVGNGEVTIANAAVAFTKLQIVCSGFVLFDKEDEVYAKESTKEEALSRVRQVDTGVDARCFEENGSSATSSRMPLRGFNKLDDTGISNGITRRSDGRRIQKLHTLKQEALSDLFDSLPAQQSIVIICRFHYDLAQIHKIAKVVGRVSAEVSGRPGRPQAHIDGGVWVGPETVLAVQGSSGVEGLDLTRAHVMCYYSYTLELGRYIQSRARIRRAGQTQPCTYYHLVVQGGIDQKIRRLLEKKQHVLEGLFTTGGVEDKAI